MINNWISDKGGEGGRLCACSKVSLQSYFGHRFCTTCDSDLIKLFMARSVSVKLKDRLGFLISEQLGELFWEAFFFFYVCFGVEIPSLRSTVQYSEIVP